MPDKEEKIRARAYALWERDGYAHGSHERHWDEAERQINAEEARDKVPSAGMEESAGGQTSEAPNTEMPATAAPAKRRKGTSSSAEATRSPRPKASKTI